MKTAKKAARTTRDDCVAQWWLEVCRMSPRTAAGRCISIMETCGDPVAVMRFLRKVEKERSWRKFPAPKLVEPESAWTCKTTYEKVELPKTKGRKKRRHQGLVRGGRKQ